MKRLFLFSILIISSVFYTTQPVSAASGVIYGPYIQRVTMKAATILIQTDASEAVTLHYRELGTQWRTMSDTQPKNRHRYRLTDLKPNTTYEYVVLRGNTPITQEYTFTTLHTITNDDPLKIAVVGDSGEINKDTLRVVSQMQQWKPEMILHTGDIAYTEGTLPEFISGFFKPYQPLIATTPLYAAMGNHEFTTEQGSVYKDVLEMPTSKTGGEDYYSFTIDSVHVVSLNTNLDYSVGSKQYRWLKQDLAKSKEKWKIVIFHHPPFSSGEHGTNHRVVFYLVPVFEATGVDLVLNGHDHDYERNASLNGVDYIVTGGGGKGVYEKTHSAENPYSKKFVSENHFVGLKVYPDKISLRAINKWGDIIDSYTIKE